MPLTFILEDAFTCSLSHQKIWFLDHNCPLCEAAKAYDEALAKLEQDVIALEGQIEHYQQELGI